MVESRGTHRLDLANGQNFAGSSQRKYARHTQQGNETRIDRAAIGSLAGFWLPTSSQGTAGKTGFSIHWPKEGDLRSWVFLASTPRVPRGAATRFQPNLLGAEAAAKYRAGPAKLG